MVIQWSKHRIYIWHIHRDWISCHYVILICFLIDAKGRWLVEVFEGWVNHAFNVFRQHILPWTTDTQPIESNADLQDRVYWGLQIIQFEKSPPLAPPLLGVESDQEAESNYTLPPLGHLWLKRKCEAWYGFADQNLIVSVSFDVSSRVSSLPIRPRRFSNLPWTLLERWILNTGHPSWNQHHTYAHRSMDDATDLALRSA